MKLNIREKVLILVLGMGLITFLALGICSYLGSRVVQKDMQTMSAELGKKSAEFTDELLISQLKETLGELAVAKAQFIDRQMSTAREDVIILSEAMSYIISHPNNYAPKTLPDPRTDPVHNAEPYIIYAPDIRDNLTPELKNEIAVASNIKEILSETLKTYEGYHATTFVGSKNGWHIGCRLVDTDLSENKPISFSNDRIYEFDPRKRPWFIQAEKAGMPVISELYRTVEANSSRQLGASAPFYDASGNFAGVVGIDIASDEIYDLVNATIDSDDCSFILNQHGEVIFVTHNYSALSVEGGDLRLSSEKSLAHAATMMLGGESGVLSVTVAGENFYLAFAPMSETKWSFGQLVPEAQVLSFSKNTRDYFVKEVKTLQNQLDEEYSYMKWLIVGIPAALLMILFLSGIKLSQRFAKPIHELSDGVREITALIGENFTEKTFKKLDIKTGDEIEELADDFNKMTDNLKAQMLNLEKETAEKQRIATGLDVATEIQAGMLPKDFSVDESERISLFATMTPAKEVGGDFYDFYKFGENHVVITVADVSGKGIPAAMFMVSAKNMLNNFAMTLYQSDGLAAAVEAANEKLCANNDAMMFVTAFVGVLDLQTGEFTFVNAGHNPPVLYRAEKNSCEFLDVKKNFVLGPMDGIPFVEQKISFKRGDLLFVYTDGVTEALNVKNEEYLPDRLIKFMNSTDCRVDLQTLLKNIRADVADHVGEAEQSDDITLFAFRYNGHD
ncbi:MAG: SpoIIE family protein phosphatase [Selenomonadaceae bacterium]|nr:SpoIIE family protein phosphatase [Selenomonadaceae bacterium]